MKWPFGKKHEHKHLADTSLGVERYGEITLMSCACGASRLFSPNADYPTWFYRHRAG